MIVLLLLTRCVKLAKTQYRVFKCSEATGSASVTTEKWFFLSDHVPCLTHHPHSQSPQSVPPTDPLSHQPVSCGCFDSLTPA